MMRRLIGFCVWLMFVHASLMPALVSARYAGAAAPTLAPVAPDGQRLHFGRCYLEWRGTDLVIGNDRVERRWRISDGLLHATSLRAGALEWLAEPVRDPSAYAAPDLREEARDVRLWAGEGKWSPTEETSLVAEVALRGPRMNLRYRFQIFPGVPGVTVELTTEHHDAAEARPHRAARCEPSTASGIESGPDRTSDDAWPVGDALEDLILAPRHLKLIQVTLLDQTDAHDELVFEKEWLLHPSEAELSLAGNLFVVEDPLSRSGLIFLKQAPLPHARPEKTEADLRVSTKGMDLRDLRQSKSGARAPMVQGYRFIVVGSDAGSDGAPGYPFLILSYQGGPVGRTVALQAYQRALRRYEPARDGMFLSNTWGDRSRDARVQEDFMHAEIEAGSRLGVDVIQIDDGWQRGRSKNSAEGQGVWNGFWAAEPGFWDADPLRFPRGLAPLVQSAHHKGMRFGLWYAPDSSQDFANWERDASKILELHRRLGVDYFKIDAVKVTTRGAERNLHRFFERVLTESDGRVTFDLDVTAEVRPGYFGAMRTGPIFVENRYTDWHRYWPHQTLRNFWTLAHYVDPLRMRFEFLNNARNAALYAGDPLAPSSYSPAYLFATTLFANPLGWFETSRLPARYFEEVGPLVRTWKMHRGRLFRGWLLPIGERPDGTSWTGFVSVGPECRNGYLLLFRERNDRSQWSADLPLFARGTYRTTALAGHGSATLKDGRLEARIPKALDFLFLSVQLR